MRAIASVVVLALVSAGAVYYLGSSSDTEQPESVQTVPSTATEGSAAVAMQATGDLKSKNEIPRERRLYFPDGSYLEALNGAINPAPVQFRDRPFAPVIGKVQRGDRVWYQHADGSQSTTFMGWRKDLGRDDANTVVAHPAETRPLLVDEVVGPGGIAPPPPNQGSGGNAPQGENK